MLPGIIFSALGTNCANRHMPANRCIRKQTGADTRKRTSTSTNLHNGHGPEPRLGKRLCSDQKSRPRGIRGRHPGGPAKEAYSSFTRSGTDLKTSTHSVSGL